ncbi:protein C2-DOMAIN ABA-RELATED 5-like isoform X2 [Andrographis paniculata]|uniref:protein C2-DOMAIN ABA-RELATED 5-like isoform X2 n=1 Tax=Andrographis paniculata TaxID=175694 RepID=UPI0021E8DF30|nr:protein C2-DOMAIN ABA-RELATED 5-like isoform X2 [Andrographis paniculata]
MMEGFVDCQKVRSGVVRKNVNPEWNEELTLTVSDPNLPITLKVYDKDTFSRDDKMGDAEFSIKEFVEAQKKVPDLLENKLPSGIVIEKIKPNRHNSNCQLSEESPILWLNGKLTQHMFLRLRNVECGEIELTLNWFPIPHNKI